MPGSSRLCPSQSCWSRLLNTINNFGEGFLSGAPRTSKALEVASSALYRTRPPLTISAPILGFLSSTRVESQGSCSAWQRESESGRWELRIVSWPRIAFKSDFQVASRGFSLPSSSLRNGRLFQGQSQTLSTAHPEEKRVRTGQASTRPQRRGKRNIDIRTQSKSRKRFLSRRAAEAARPKSSTKESHSEHVKGKARPNAVVRGDSRKKRFVSAEESGHRPARARHNSSVFREIKFKGKEGPKVRRKRIRPHPKDITYKRSLDTETVEDAEQPLAQEETSLNAQFRQIQPPRELLTHIEENLLGRRRLAEWRRHGYDPERTAPLDDLPGSKEKRSPIQESVFKKKLTFVAAAKQSPSLPILQFPEVAFAGRSNVGKSSLINALTRQWGIARTSEKPGLTQSINFFTLGSQLCLVDLPGYGFAYAKKEKKEEWEELVKEFVQTRPNLKRVCLLVDAKWGLKPRDEELIYLMESAGTRFQVVLTKTDILPPVDLARRATQILQAVENHKHLVHPLIMVSSKTGAGLELFRSSLARVSGQSRLLQEAAA